MKRSILVVSFLLLALIPAYAFWQSRDSGYNVTGGPPPVNMSSPVFSHVGLPNSGTAAQFGGTIASSTSASWGAASTGFQTPIPADGGINGLYSALVNANTGAVVVDNINGTDKTLTCSYTPASAPFFVLPDSTHTDTVSAGDLFQWHWTTSTAWAQGATTSQRISFLFTASGGQIGIMLTGPSAATVAGATVNAWVGLNTAASTAGTADTNVSSLMPEGGALNSLYCFPNATENTTPHICTVWKNGSATALTCTLAASSGGGCCVNLTSSGHIGGSGGPSCSSSTSVTFVLGDKISVNFNCAGGDVRPPSRQGLG